MKYTIVLTLAITSTIAWAEPVRDFNKVLIQDVQKQITKDDDSFKSKKSSRAPASVDDVEVAPMEEPSKIDKNVRQIGPNRW